jgi:hypothetical protein
MWRLLSHCIATGVSLSLLTSQFWLSADMPQYEYYTCIQALSMPTQILTPTATGQNMMRLAACSNVSALKMDAVHFSETSGNFCQTARRIISEDSTPQLFSQIHKYRHSSRDILLNSMGHTGTWRLNNVACNPEAEIESSIHRKVPRLTYFARRRTWDHETSRGRATFVAGRCPYASSTCVLLRWHKTIKLWGLEGDAKHQDLAVLMRGIFAWVC